MKDTRNASEARSGERNFPVRDLRAGTLGGLDESGNLLEKIMLPEAYSIGQAERQQLLTRFLEHCETPREFSKAADEVDYLFRRFFIGDEFRVGLLLQFEPDQLEVCGKNWVKVDLEAVECNAREAGKVTLEFENEYFDLVLCSGLDRISRPASLVAEARRVLKRRGLVWAQAPLSNAHDSGGSETQQAYWRFTPEGFRVLFERFDEIMCSVYQSPGNIAQQDSFFYGLKPEIASETSNDRAHTDPPSLLPL